MGVCVWAMQGQACKRAAQGRKLAVHVAGVRSIVELRGGGRGRVWPGVWAGAGVWAGVWPGCGQGQGLMGRYAAYGAGAGWILQLIMKARVRVGYSAPGCG